MTCLLCERLLSFEFTVQAPHEHDGQWYGRAPCGCVRTVRDVRLCDKHDSIGMLGFAWSTLIMPEADVLTPWRAVESVEGLVRS